MLKKIVLLAGAVLSLTLNAQDQQPAMADTMRSDGKIYVVITVLSIIFLALAGFLVVIERRVKKLEDELKKNGTN